MVHTPLIILASASPRRAQLLADAGYQFRISVPTLPEPPLDPLGHPEAQAMALSYFKARSVLDSLADNSAVVLGADTVVAKDGTVFGKPTDLADARRILTELTSGAHRVLTGVSVVCRSDGGQMRRWIGCAVTAITMRPMVGKEMDDYLASGDWQGKAGAYGIQDCGDLFVTRIDGSFSNVVGLPMELLADMLKAF